MTSLNGFIKLHRKLLTWRWYQDSVVKDVFIHLLLLASFKERPWKAIIVQEGQAIVSTQKLADDLGFSRQQVRKKKKKLKSTNEITIEATNRFTVITIVKWRDYQSEFKTPANESTNSLTNNQPTENQLITNNQPHRKNVKNVKNNDLIYITDNDGNRVKYKVYNTYETSSTDFDYATRETQGKREITLSTCTDDVKSRIIVWAREE